MRGDLVWMAVLFLLTAAFRFLALTNGFQNDHFLHLASAQQMSYGEWPTRDFVDPGQPLMIVYSAIAQAVLGRTLFAEAVFVSAAFGAAAALTFAAVREMTASTSLALLAVVLEVAVFPRTYGYPKMLVYAFGLWCFVRHVAKPSPARLALIAVSVAVAFLFRHDHGVFLGIGAVLTVMLAPDVTSAKEAWRRLLTLAALVLAFTLPYLVYVQAYQGHIWPNPFTSEQPLQAALLYLLLAVSVFAVGQPLEELDRAGLTGSVRLYPQRFGERTRALTTPLEPMQMPSRTAASLRPFLEYVQRCTPPEGRLLTAGFIPEVSYLARRPYAAGQSTFGPWWGSEEMQQLALRRLRDQVVPFVILPGEYREEFNARFPLIAGYVRARYALLATIDINDEDVVDIFVNNALPPARRDADSGWPCFRATPS